jgi:SAM-dependent methyltransferase
VHFEAGNFETRRPCNLFPFDEHGRINYPKSIRCGEHFCLAVDTPGFVWLDCAPVNECPQDCSRRSWLAARLAKGGEMKLENVNCALCGGADSELIFTAPSLRLSGPGNHFDLRRCTKCGLVFMSPRPAPEELAALYQPKFYHSPNQKLVQRIAGLILGESVSFVQRHAGPSKLLDVGCGNGSFIQGAARAGFDVYGLEPYQSALPNLPESLRTRVLCAPFESADYPAESFDVITLWHVLEHLSGPVETLKRLRVFLKPGGTLILEVPNIASSEARWLGPHWHNLDLPYHFWHFAPETLQSAVQQAGFEIKTCVTSARTRPVWLLNYLLLGANSAGQWWQSRHPGWSKRPRMTRLLGLLLCLGNRVMFAGNSPMMRVVCRKREKS